MFGQLVRAIRTRLNLTQQDLASSLGVSRVSVSYYETGRNLPQTRVFLHLYRLADPGERLEMLELLRKYT